jgi:hypothetical protein
LCPGGGGEDVGHREEAQPPPAPHPNPLPLCLLFCSSAAGEGVVLRGSVNFGSLNSYDDDLKKDPLKPKERPERGTLSKFQYSLRTNAVDEEFVHLRI